MPMLSHCGSNGRQWPPEKSQLGGTQVGVGEEGVDRRGAESARLLPAFEVPAWQRVLFQAPRQLVETGVSPGRGRSGKVRPPSSI